MESRFYYIIRLLDSNYSYLLFVNTDWDPKNVCRFLVSCFIVKA